MNRKTSSRRNQKSTRKTAGSATKAPRSTKSSTTASANNAMRLTKRLVDVRRHTQGYIAGGKQYSVAQVRQMAKSGRIRGVQVVGQHIQALPGQPRLTDLPTQVVKN